MKVDPNCPTCEGWGVVDSGGITPWGHPIEIPCPDCNTRKPNKRTVCVDFDGVIHSFTSRWYPGCPPLDPPVSGAFDFLSALLAAGHRVIVFSCRCESEEGRQGIRDWFYKHGYSVPLELSHTKPIADIYIDDRAFEFRGLFPTIDYIERFKPWNH